MKILRYLSAMAALTALAACDDVKSIPMEEIRPPYTYGDAYYENLRDYKASDHEIAFGWFADYNSYSSEATSFLGLPDSLDICSLWGGIPSDPQTLAEMRFVQKTKGTKMLSVAITRIMAESADKEFRKVFAEGREEGNAEKIEKGIIMYAEHFLDGVFLNDLDGFDADYEPEGDPLSGSYFETFYKHLAKYMGPNPDITKEERRELIRERYGDEMASRDGICDKLLCIDAPSGKMGSMASYSNYFFFQAYGGGTSGSGGGWPDEKVVLCCNMGDNWGTDLQGMYNQAAATPRGGFGAFYIHRNYRITETNIEPYYHFRRCIQIQNPAIY
ncbi:glycoside hydrolase family 18 [uncultured Muribaculum sp.]|uniref:glycoside hydrolase family 18 n=1 Tax=uncultured Muribaculum sp. TaxID=1918613 RepID=UPI0025FFD33A|nr:glycoside hydrolase family 18 [uncultured Muribaculum sp.]